jgi:hypothetical protein
MRGPALCDGPAGRGERRSRSDCGLHESVRVNWRAFAGIDDVCLAEHRLNDPAEYRLNHPAENSVITVRWGPLSEQVDWGFIEL